MYAIFKTGGKQYKVKPGDVIRVEKIRDKDGSSVKFDTVLAVNDDNELHVGTPFLDAATVSATVLGEGKAKKVIIFKYKAKKDYRKKQGHRQPYTELEIDSIELDGTTIAKKTVRPPKPVKEEVEEEAEADEKPAKKTKSKAKTDKPEVQEETAETAAPESEDAAAELEELSDAAETPVTEDAPEAEAAVDEATEDLSKLTKPELQARLDEAGITYLKSLKKDELIALLQDVK